MPQLVLFRGRPVKRRQRTASGIRLLFVSAKSGEPGQSLIVSEHDWGLHSTIQFFPKEQMPDVRELAAHFFADPQPDFIGEPS